MESASITNIRTRTIGYDRLGVSALFAAYVEGEGKVLKYYAQNPWRAEDRVEAARIAAAHPRDRDAVVDVLLEQNEPWWGEEEDTVRMNIEKMRDPESVVVVSGQQLGLFGGPLYTVYKALTAVKMAEQLESETGRSVVPVFWLADEDHDFAEVQATTLPNGAEPVRIAYEDGQQPDANRGPVGRIILGDGIASAVEQLFRTHPLAPAWVRENWKPGERWLDAFAHTLRRLTEGTGLVFVSGDDLRLKRLVTPLFERELERWKDTFADLTATSDNLIAADFHAQVKASPVNLFLFEDGKRLPIDPDREGFVLRGSKTRLSKEELLALLKEQPERLSPNVVLRPLIQDTLFPTAAYVAGPGEIAYFAQLKPIYDAFGVPMPVIYPRASLTLISEKLQRFLDEYEIDVPDLKKDTHLLHGRLALARSDVGLHRRFESVSTQLRNLIMSLKPSITAVDSSFDKAVEAALARAEKGLMKLEKKTIRVEKRNQHVILERLERLAGELMPTGRPQERVVCALTFLSELAPTELLESLDSDVNAHHVVSLESAKNL